MSQPVSAYIVCSGSASRRGARPRSITRRPIVWYSSWRSTLTATIGVPPVRNTPRLVVVVAAREPRPAAGRCRLDKQRQADDVVVMAVPLVHEEAQGLIGPVDRAAQLELAPALRRLRPRMQAQT